MPHASYRTPENRPSAPPPSVSAKVPVGLGTKILLLFLGLFILPVVIAFWGAYAIEEGQLRQTVVTLEQQREHETAVVLLNTIRRQRAQFALVTFFASIMAILTAVLLGRIVVHPMKQILEAIRWMGKGGKTVYLPARGNDEVAQVARAFNDLIQRFFETRERERELSKLKSEFISIAAHQLRTPLSTIKWTFRMALDGDVGQLTQEQKEFLGRGFASNERMIKLVSDLLDASRIEEGKFGYNFEPTLLEPIVDAEVAQAQQTAEHKHIRMRYEKPSDPLPQLVLDAQRIAMVFANLLSNAVNYTPPGGRVLVRVAQEKGKVKVEIQDTGVGIPREDLPRLFTKFFRAENVIRMQTEGTGMGLFIARNIARTHGGDITVSSEEGRGSTFTVELPLSR